MTTSRQQFWGKYRAQVTKTDDPYKIGRVKFKCQDVLGDRESGWALPAFPLAAGGLTPGGGVGLFLVPPKDAWVWAEFENGNPEKPIWSGCFFQDKPETLATTMSALAPLVGVDPAKKILKVGKWVVTFTDDALTIEHLAQIVPRTRVKIDGTTIKLTTEQMPGAAAPTCASAELATAMVTVGGAQIKVG